MKKIIFIVCLLSICGLFFLVRCCDYFDIEDPYKNIKVLQMYNYQFNDSVIPIYNTPEEYLFFVRKNIEYTPEKKDYWQLPEQTWERKTGDCEDMVILFMYLIETRLNIETRMSLMKNKDTEEIHVMAIIDNIYYDVSEYMSWTSLPSTWTIIWTAVYSEIIWMTYNYHDNVGKYY